MTRFAGREKERAEEVCQEFLAAGFSSVEVFQCSVYASFGDGQVALRADELEIWLSVERGDYFAEIRRKDKSLLDFTKWWGLFMQADKAPFPSKELSGLASQIFNARYLLSE